MLFKRVFAPKRVETISKSIRVPDTMWNIIEYLAKKEGETANGYIVLMLDQYLQDLIEEGKIKLPKDLLNPDKTAS